MYPAFLNITGRLCVVIGGGRVAERKVKGLLQADAYVRVISPEVTPELASLARQGKIDWRNKSYNYPDIDKAFLVFAATSSREIQQLISTQAHANKQLVNVADDPEGCNFHVPATVRRGGLSLAISTGGKSPAVASQIKQQLDNEFGPEYETLLDIMALVRQKTGAATDMMSQADRKKIYKKIVQSDIIHWIKTGQVDRLQAHLQDVLGPDADLDVNELKLDPR